jgi:hypothetical protein
MPDYLKGNYRKDFVVNRTPASDQASTEDILEQEFERRSLEKLGGSIAFIMKSKNLLWNGQAGQERDARTTRD